MRDGTRMHLVLSVAVLFLSSRCDVESKREGGAATEAHPLTHRHPYRGSRGAREKQRGVLLRLGGWPLSSVFLLFASHERMVSLSFCFRRTCVYTGTA